MSRAPIRPAALLWCLAACDGGTEPPPPPIDLPLVATVAVPPNYGLHDTFVRDGIAILNVWHTGITILDIGGGGRGGTPEQPVEITTFKPNSGSLVAPAIHNAWWYRDPSGLKRYLFLGQEGPAVIGTLSSGDLKVLDLSVLDAPVEVAFYRVAGAGAHNFWVDEANQTLYAAFYNGGVVRLDISGDLAGDLAPRERARVRPGGSDSTYVWGVMLAGGRLYASDILSGFWQLHPQTLQPVAGGHNVPERWGADLWVSGAYGYTGTWGGSPRNGTRGNVVKIWRLSATGAPTLVDSIKVEGINTVSDIEVSDDGRWLLFSTEGPTNAGVYVYRLDNPEKPVLAGSALVPQGVHTATLGRVNGRLYAFAARNPAGPAMLVFDLGDLE